MVNASTTVPHNLLDMFSVSLLLLEFLSFKVSDSLMQLTGKKDVHVYTYNVYLRTSAVTCTVHVICSVVPGPSIV